jgi:hypothetical protein
MNNPPQTHLKSKKNQQKTQNPKLTNNLLEHYKKTKNNKRKYHYKKTPTAKKKNPKKNLTQKKHKPPPLR